MHVVASGDTLSHLSRRYKTTVAAFMAANPKLADPNYIRVGQRLNIPRPPVKRERAPSTTVKKHTIKPKDTIWQLARDHGVSEQAIMDANPGVKPTRLIPGKELTIPEADEEVVPERPTVGAKVSAEPEPKVKARGPDSRSQLMQSQLHGQLKTEDTSKFAAEVKSLGVSLLKGQDIELDREVELGSLGTVEFKLDQEISDGDPRTYEQRAYNRSLRKTGEKAIWLKSGGSVELDTERETDDGKLEIDGELQATMERPYTYKKDDRDPAKLAGKLVENTTQPPLTGEAARELERGSRMTLEGTLGIEGDYETEKTETEVEFRGRAKLQMERLEGDNVEVSLETSRDIDAAMEGELRKDDKTTVEVELNADYDRGVKRTFELDLATSEGREAYDALAGFDGSRAVELAEGPGVTLKKEEETQLQRVRGKLEAERKLTDGEVEGSVELERRTTEDERRTSGTAQLSGKKEIDEETTADARLKLGRKRTEDLEDNTVTDELEVEGRAGVRTKLDEDTSLTAKTKLGTSSKVTGPDGKPIGAATTVDDIRELPEGATGRLRREGEVDADVKGESWKAGVLIERELEVKKERWSKGIVRSGSLTLDGSRDLEVGEDSKVGFSAKSSLGYRLELPLDGDEDQPLPLDAQRAQELPEGAEFELRGKASAGAKVTRELMGTELSGEHALEIDVERKSGDQVRVQVDLETATEFERNAAREADDDAERDWKLGYKGSTEVETRTYGVYDLDLSKTEHREVYDSLITGDTESADALGLRAQPKDERSLTNSDELTGEAEVSEWLGVSGSVERTSMSPSDWKVRRDSERRAFSEAQEKEGKEVRWLQVESEVNPKFGRTFTDPVTVGVSPRARVETGARVRYQAMVPSVDGEGADVSPPLKADDAQALARGSEFLFEREGQLETSFGAKVGYEMEESGTKVGASLETSGNSEGRSEVGVRVRRLEGEKVEVTLEDTSRSTQGSLLRARVGVEVDTETLSGADSIGIVTDTLDRKLNKWLRVEGKIEDSTSSTDREDVRFELDLSKPEARSAYEQLLAFDGDRAIALAAKTRAGEDTGVTITSGTTERVDQRSEERSLEVGPDTLYLSKALRSDRTRIDQWSERMRRTDTSEFEGKYKGLLGRKQEVDWEAVWVRSHDDPKGRGFYRLQYKDEDPISSKKQVRRAIRLADELETEPARPIKAEKSSDRGLSRILGDLSYHGETETNMDVFFTQSGIESLAKYSEEEAYEAYAKTLIDRGEIDEAPGWVTGGAKARKPLVELERLDADIGLDQREYQNKTRELEIEYYRATKREAWQDEEHFSAAHAFASMVGSIREGEDPARWGKAFADLGDRARFEFYDALSTMNRLAGSDEVLVNRFQIEGDAVDVLMKEEGRTSRP